MNRNFSDIVNFLSKLTWARASNISQIILSYYGSRFFKKPMVIGMPISISIEPTTSCNLRCPECISGLRAFTRPTGMLNVELFKLIMDQLVSSLSYLIFYFQGEPYLHQSLLEMVSYAASKKIYTAISTNAHFLTSDWAKQTVESKLDRLIISVDGATPEIYRSYRVGGDFNKVIEGTKNVIYWKKKLKSSTPHVIFQCLLVKHNEHQMDDIKKLARELGVDEVAFKTAQIYDYKNGSDLMPTNQKYSRYRKSKNGQFEIKNKLLNHCWKMWHSCVITWDGKIVPCCFDKDGKYVLGNVNQQTFKQIWEGEKYNQFRNTLLQARKHIDICENCTEGGAVWY